MNFQAVREANEQNVTMSGVLAKADGTTFTQSNKPKQAVKITDANNEQQSVTIYQGTGVAIPLEKVGQTLSFNLSYKTSYRKGYYGGFWNDKAQVAPLQSQPDPQQAASQPHQPSNAPAVGDTGIEVRHDVVCAFLQGGKEPRLSDVEYWMNFIETGKAPPPAAQEEPF